MELRTIGGHLRPGSAFRPIAIAYFLGAGVFIAPMFVLVTLIQLAVGGPATLNGKPIEAGAATLFTLLPLVVLPLVLAGQAVLFGGLIVFGLWLYQRRKPIRVVPQDEA